MDSCTVARCHDAPLEVLLILPSRIPIHGSDSTDHRPELRSSSRFSRIRRILRHGVVCRFLDRPACTGGEIPRIETDVLAYLCACLGGDIDVLL